MKTIKHLIVTCTALFMVTALAAATQASSQSGLFTLVKVESVHDGDTFSIKLENKDEKVRILGIDTPELSEKNKFHCLGSEVAKHMKEKIEGKEVKLIRDTKGKNRDGFGRLLRTVEMDGNDIGAELLKIGYAQLYQPGVFTKKPDYVKLQATAKKNKIGVWSDQCASHPHKTTLTPETRSTIPTQPSITCPNDKPIKGNISAKGEKIYHQPGGQFYNKTIIGDILGEKCFATAKDAEKDGFRAPLK